MNNEPERPSDHQRLIAAMQESKAPPADADTPPIPAEMLERLHERYGNTEPVRRRVVVEEKASFWSQLMGLFAQPRFVMGCTALLLLVGIGVFMLPSKPDEELLRGGDVKPVTLPVYWVSKTAPEPAGIGMPPFIVIAADQLPNQGNAIVFDPVLRTARLIRDDGKPGASIDITDPADADEWLAAHRQLSSLAKP